MVTAIFSLAGGAGGRRLLAGLACSCGGRVEGLHELDCTYLRHGCSSSAAVEATPPLAMAQMLGGLIFQDAWSYVSALSCGGSSVWFAMDGFWVSDLASAGPC